MNTPVLPPVHMRNKTDNNIVRAMSTPILSRAHMDCVLGMQWGDEGKGKIVDYISKQYDYIVRFQGGSNAGHTIIVHDNKYVLHLIPSGILHTHTTCILGSGMVIDPVLLAEEMEMLQDINIKNRIYISNKAHIIMPYHTLIDSIQDQKRGETKIGTTKKGIGPCYADKSNRIGIRMALLHDEEQFAAQLRINVDYYNKVLTKIYARPPMVYTEILDTYLELARKMRKYVVDTDQIIHNAVAHNKSLLLEGAQGVMLDIDHGTYPFVTSSSTTIGGAIAGSMMPLAAINNIIGITKSYTTRVGAGPFPSECIDAMGDLLQRAGGEFGATTGRKRRCGWFDAVLVGRAIQQNGIAELALTKLDVLSGIKTLKICVAHEYEHAYTSVNLSDGNLNGAVACYQECDGWAEDIRTITRYADLPVACKKYVETIEEMVLCKVSMISVGPQRDQIIIR